MGMDFPSIPPRHCIFPSTASLILRLQPSTLKSFQALQLHTHSLRSFWTKRRGFNAQNNPCWERKALARNRDGEPRRGSVLTPTEEICSDKVMEFCDAENAVKGRTVVEDSDLRVQTRGTMDEPVKKMNLRKK